MFDNRTTYYAKDGIEPIVVAGNELVAHIRAGSIPIEDARVQAQALMVRFDEVVGTPVLTESLGTYHGNIPQMEAEKLGESLAINVAALHHQHARLLELDAQFASRF